jgi:uncharacterized protein YbjT (DUF2867 family)
VLALRAAFFFENHFLSLGRIKAKGANGSPIGPDVPISMIATSDIAEVAARALRQLDFKGFVVRELLGERDLTMRESRESLATGSAGRTCGTSRFPPPILLKGFCRWGCRKTSPRMWSMRLAA